MLLLIKFDVALLYDIAFSLDILNKWQKQVSLKTIFIEIIRESVGSRLIL